MSLRLYLLGAPRLELDGQPIALERSKSLALLAYLAVTRRAHTRLALATLFWPDYPPESAYAYLRRSIWDLNHALGEGWLAAGRDTVQIDAGCDCWLDVDEFHMLLAGCVSHSSPPAGDCRSCQEDLADAASLYHGDFMAGFSLRDSPAFDDWQVLQTESLRRELLSALDQLSRCLAEQGGFTKALEYARRRLSLDPLDETAHRRVMLLYAQAGQRSAALLQYEECRRLLKDELKLQPEPETTRLAERIRQGEIMAPSSEPGQPFLATPAVTPVQSAHTPQYALPAQPTPFVGRQPELAQIAALLEDPACRLLTLLGPGGIGKTRLAIQAAAELTRAAPEVFSHGVCFVSLAAQQSPEFLPSTIADALQFSFNRDADQSDQPPDPPKVQLFDYLRQRRILLVLDNFEHLAHGAGLLSEILSAAPSARLLVTSRVRLNLPEEWVLEVFGLPFPQDSVPGALEEYASLQLFVQSARRVRLGFTPTPEDGHSLVRICRLLEGVPLAIELAAAWTKMLSLPEIAAEITASLDFLSSTGQGVPERHRSLRLLFEHSWALLSPVEKQAFRRLSVFRGSFSRQAAEQVAKANLFLLSSLVDKSLLHLTTAGRFEMHELLKQYAQEKRTEAGDESVYERHASYYAGLLEETDARLHGSEQMAALQLLTAELEDLRQAWRWMVSHQRIDLLRRSIPALILYYSMSGRFPQELEDMELVIKGIDNLPAGDSDSELVLAFAFARAAAISSDFSTAERAEAYYSEALERSQRLEQPYRAMVSGLISFGVWRQPLEAVLASYNESVEAFTQAGERWWIAMAHLTIAEAFEEAQHSKHVMQYARQSQAIFQSLGDRWATALALNTQSELAFNTGDFIEARRLVEQGLEIHRQVGDPVRTARALLILGEIAVSLGEYNTALQRYQESLVLLRELGGRSSLAAILDSIGYVFYLLEDYEQAERCYLESLEYSQALGSLYGEGMTLQNLGDLASMRGELEQARQLYQESLFDLQQVAATSWGMMIVLKKMARVLARLGETGEAWRYYRRALQAARQAGRYPEMLENLVDISRLLAEAGKLERAVELLALCLEQDAAAQTVLEGARQFLAEFEAELPPQVAAAARLRGRALDLERVIDEMIDSSASPPIA